MVGLWDCVGVMAQEKLSLESLSPTLYSRLTMPERALSRRYFSICLARLEKQNPGCHEDNLRQAVRQAYSKTIFGLIVVSSPIWIVGASFISYRDSGGIFLSVGIALLAVEAIWLALVMIRAVQEGRYLRQNQ